MSATKRRAGAAASPEMSTPDPVKRRKRNDDTFFPDAETVETTTELGMKIIRLLKKSQDKNGRNVATHFLDLPSKDEYPQYYTQVKMPISLNMIENRLDNGEYDTMERLESDLKRLVQNAKEFNSTKSEVYEDAERIRKALSNFMPKHNPAYQDPNYRAYPTPIPRELLDRDVSMSDAPPTGQPEKVKLVLTNNRAARRKSQALSTENGGDDASEEMITEQLDLLDELSDLPDAPNFVEKPPRKTPHYYQIVKRPTSISDVRKLVEQGRIRDWNNFATEVRLIWQNAKLYNEDGSDIYLMAEELEEWFEEKVQEHGVAPPGPASTATSAPTNIKLRLGTAQQEPQKLKLSFGARSIPAQAAPVFDDIALRRQKEETGEALNQISRVSSNAIMSNGLTSIPQAIKRSDSAAASQPGANVVRPASSQMNSDFARGMAPMQNHVSRLVPTPVMPGYPPPTNFIAQQPVNGGYHAEIAYTQKTQSLLSESDNPIERKFRDSGKGLEHAILGSVTFMTHPDPSLNLPKWKLDRYASATQTQTASYIYLPSDHYYFRVIPHLTAECKKRRRYRVCVSRNWEQIFQSPATPGIYDFRLNPGENIIAVDVIADLAEGDSKPYAPPQLQLDFERITFIVMLRQPTPER